MQLGIGKARRYRSARTRTQTSVGAFQLPLLCLDHRISSETYKATLIGRLQESRASQRISYHV